MSHWQDCREGETSLPDCGPVTCFPTPALQTPRLLPTQRAAGTGKTAEPWVILAVWSGRAPGTSRPWPSKELGPQATTMKWGGVGCNQLAPPPLAPTSTPHPPGEQSTKVPSLAVLRQPQSLTISTPPPPQASLPIHMQQRSFISSPQTSWWSAGQGSLFHR